MLPAGHREDQFVGGALEAATPEPDAAAENEVWHELLRQVRQCPGEMNMGSAEAWLRDKELPQGRARDLLAEAVVDGGAPVQVKGTGNRSRGKFLHPGTARMPPLSTGSSSTRFAGGEGRAAGNRPRRRGPAEAPRGQPGAYHGRGQGAGREGHRDHAGDRDGWPHPGVPSGRRAHEAWHGLKFKNIEAAYERAKSASI